MNSELTILIVARNAEATIERALCSAFAEDGCRVLLVDDHSTDGTVLRARSAGGARLTVVQAPPSGGVAVARQCALDAVGTPFAAWLDADDQWLPGRAARLLERLRAGADVVADAIELLDGPSGRWLRRIDVPEALRAPGGAVRLFERNLLPGDTQVGFRVAALREAGGIDTSLHGPESYDLLLRVVRQGATFSFLDEAGYRMYAYPDSVSRRLDRQRAELARVLRKHPYEAVRQLYAGAGHDPRIGTWALVAMAMFRYEPDAALGWLDQLPAEAVDDARVLEIDGPWPQPERWRVAFTRGTAWLLAGRDAEALEALARAETLLGTAESANNLGVALARLGRPHEARDAFTLALARFPGYVDATLNLAGLADHVTTHPLRRAPSRSEYPVPGLSS